MPRYMDTRPFRVWYSESTGIAEGHRGAQLKSESFRTLEEARLVAKRLPESHSLIRITEGPDHSWVEHPA